MVNKSEQTDPSLWEELQHQSLLQLRLPSEQLQDYSGLLKESQLI